jgi:hypothetical protein
MVRDALARHGDSGVTPRHTLFFFHGEGGHDDLVEVAKRAGFVTSGADDSTILETTMAVDEASFAPVSAMMQSWAAAFQLDYDGWECAVVTN